jgi:hypothetical protein
MKLSLEDIRAKFDALVDGTQTLEQIAASATAAMRASDERRLDLEEKFADQIWEAVLYLSGVDLQVSPGRYLHNRDDFLNARQRILGEVQAP